MGTDESKIICDIPLMFAFLAFIVNRELFIRLMNSDPDRSMLNCQCFMRK